MSPWRPAATAPEAVGVTALLAVPPGLKDDPSVGWTLLAGIYYWSADGWRHEVTGALVMRTDVWWLAESEVLALLPALRCGAGVAA